MMGAFFALSGEHGRKSAIVSAESSSRAFADGRGRSLL